MTDPTTEEPTEDGGNVGQRVAEQDAPAEAERAPKDLLDAFAQTADSDQSDDPQSEATEATGSVQHEVPQVSEEEVAEEIAEELLATAEAVAEVAEVDELEVEEAIAETDSAMEAMERVEETTLPSDAELVGVSEESKQSESPFNRPGRWFVCHTYAGYENKVKSNLETRIRSMNMEERIFEVVIPMEDVIEFKGGRKTVVKKKVFPGYLMVRIALDDDSWYVVRNTPGVTGFVGSGAKPTPLSRKEVENILGTGEVVEEGAAVTEKKARPRLEYEEGETVRVTSGPFADFNGAVSEIDVDRSKLKVMVNIFGRETPVELDFGQVAKL